MQSSQPRIDLYKDQAFVRSLFNDTAPYYDAINQIFSLGSGAWYRRRCLRRAGLRTGNAVLDVAVGTGLIAQSALKIIGAGGSVIGLDLSEAMLTEVGRKLQIPLIQGNAETLPLADHSVDFVVMGYAIRHIADLPGCFAEFWRVLKPGGTLLLLEISSPRRAIFQTTLAQYLARAVPRISQMVTRQPKVRSLMNYHWETMRACVPPQVILDTMTQSGFLQLNCEAWFDLFRSYTGHKQAS